MEATKTITREDLLNKIEYITKQAHEDQANGGLATRAKFEIGALVFTGQVFGLLESQEAFDLVKGAEYQITGLIKTGKYAGFKFELDLVTSGYGPGSRSKARVYLSECDYKRCELSWNNLAFYNAPKKWETINADRKKVTPRGVSEFMRQEMDDEEWENG